MDSQFTATFVRVVLVVRNNDAIVETLTQCWKQEYPRGFYEIISADGGSTQSQE